MSKWVWFNLVVFLIIVILVIFMKITGKEPANLAPNPSPTATPEITEPLSESGETSMVLGSATEPSSLETKTQLTFYQSTTLPYTAMLPEGWFINKDVLTNYDPQKRIDPKETTTQDTECTFTRLTVLPSNAQILEQKTLEEQDLPTVEYTRYTTSLSSDVPATPIEVFVLKDEQNIAKVQLNCRKNNGDPQSLYSILNAVRFSSI